MTYHRLATITAIVALCVIVLGAYVRLSHAGLGCPDWPGCYGQLTWPAAPAEVEAANVEFPERPVSTEKAWKEMAHRYLAGTLGLLILAMAILAWRRRGDANVPLKLSFALVALVLFQAALGAWTVTLKLKPLVVMAHLVGGITTFALLIWAALSSRPAERAAHRGVYRAGLLAMVVLVAQIMLGGWVSSNYAAVSCPDFPQCQDRWWPEMDFGEGFTLWRGIGVDYEGGVLDLPARTAIHMAHRIGAIVATAFVLFAVVAAFRQTALRAIGIGLLGLLAAQLLLGITNVVGGLPLPVAAAHNGVAALTVGALTWLLYRARPA